MAYAEDTFARKKKQKRIFVLFFTHLFVPLQQVLHIKHFTRKQRDYGINKTIQGPFAQMGKGLLL